METRYTTVVATKENRHLIIPFLKSLGGRDSIGVESTINDPYSQAYKVDRFYIEPSDKIILPMYVKFKEERQRIVEIPEGFGKEK